MKNPLMESLKMIDRERDWLKPKIEELLNNSSGWVLQSALESALLPYMSQNLVDPRRILRHVLDGMVREGTIASLEPIGGDPRPTKYVGLRWRIKSSERSSLSGKFEQPEKEVDKLLNPRRKIRLDD